MSPSPLRCGLGPWRYSLSRPQRVPLCYGPLARSLPWGDLVDRLQSFSFHHLCYPNYGALTSTPAGLSPAEHASIRWTHNRTGRSTASLGPEGSLRPTREAAGRHRCNAASNHAAARESPHQYLDRLRLCIGTAVHWSAAENPNATFDEIVKAVHSWNERNRQIMPQM